MPPAHILIVEDMPENAVLLQSQLSALWPPPSTTYTLAESMAATQQACATQEPSLVVLDLNLPDSQGLDSLDTLIAMLPAYIPIIVISGYITRLEGFQAIHRGADSYLLKGEHWTMQAVCERVSAAWARAEGWKYRRGKETAFPGIPNVSTEQAVSRTGKQWHGFCVILGAAILCGMAMFAVRLQATSPVWGYRLSSIYYVVGCPQYPKPPIDPKRWEVFLLKEDAEQAGYRMARNCKKEERNASDH